LKADSGAEQPSDDAIVQFLGRRHSATWHALTHNQSRDLAAPPSLLHPRLHSNIPPSSYRTKPAHPICQAEGCCLACTALGVRAPSRLSSKTIRHNGDSHRSTLSKPSFLCLGDSNLKANMTSLAETYLLATCPRASAAALGTLVVTPRCHSRRATLVSPQECPRVPRAARRTCTDAREESVLKIGPVPRAHTLNVYHYSADDLSCRQPSGGPGCRQQTHKETKTLSMA